MKTRSVLQQHLAMSHDKQTKLKLLYMKYFCLFTTSELWVIREAIVLADIPGGPFVTFHITLNTAVSIITFTVVSVNKIQTRSINTGIAQTFIHFCKQHTQHIIINYLLT